MSEQKRGFRARDAPANEVEAQVSKKPRLEIQESASFTSFYSATGSKQQFGADSNRFKRNPKHKKINLPEPCSPEDVLWQEIKYVLGAETVEKAIESGVEFDSPFSPQEEVEVIVKSLSAGGGSLILQLFDS